MKTSKGIGARSATVLVAAATAAVVVLSRPVGNHPDEARLLVGIGMTPVMAYNHARTPATI